MSQVNSTSISDMFNTAFDSISTKGEELKKKMADMKDVSTEDMLKLQFEMGQYNALLEALSTVTKSMTDEAKNIAQRSN